MTIKTVSFATLFFAGTVAATASLTSFSPAPLETAAEHEPHPAEQMTNRGTRTPPVTRSNVDSPVGSQPRRGERTDFVPVSIAMSMPAGDGLRRGTR